MNERIQFSIVLCLTCIALSCIFVSANLESLGRNAPPWLGTLGGAAAGGLLTLAQPIRRGNGNGH